MESTPLEWLAGRTVMDSFLVSWCKAELQFDTNHYDIYKPSSTDLQGGEWQYWQYSTKQPPRVSDTFNYQEKQTVIFSLFYINSLWNVNCFYSIFLMANHSSLYEQHLKTWQYFKMTKNTSRLKDTMTCANHNYFFSFSHCTMGMHRLVRQAQILVFICINDHVWSSPMTTNKKRLNLQHNNSLPVSQPDYC